MAKNYFPPYRQEQYQSFLSELGVTPATANAMQKVAWLASLIEDGESLSWKTWCQYGVAITQDDEQAEIVRSYTRYPGDRRRFSPPGQPARPMPRSVFRDLLNEWKPVRDARMNASHFRARLMLKLTWASGATVSELVMLRQNCFEETRTGGILSLPGTGLLRARDIPIEWSEDEFECPLRELTSRIQQLEDNPKAFIFPQITPGGVYLWDRANQMESMNRLMRIAERRLKIHRYPLRSARLSFILQTYQRCGPALSFHYSGLKHIETFVRLIKREPNWKRIQTIL